jgi:hypothetical protein
MARDQRSLRGDVNVALNGLIREGVIAAFETNFDGISVLVYDARQFRRLGRLEHGNAG